VASSISFHIIFAVLIGLKRHLFVIPSSRLIWSETAGRTVFGSGNQRAASRFETEKAGKLNRAIFFMR